MLYSLSSFRTRNVEHITIESIISEISFQPIYKYKTKCGVCAQCASIRLFIENANHKKNKNFTRKWMIGQFDCAPTMEFHQVILKFRIELLHKFFPEKTYKNGSF